jgi:hypothetical protein
MRLSEGLVLRADTQKRIQRIGGRLKLSALVQEGETPPEDPQELLAELGSLAEQLRDLIARINKTNASAHLESGETITDALARRDVLSLHYRILWEFAREASDTSDRQTHTEIRVRPTVNVAALRRQLDSMAKERRDIDMAIQAANWSTDLEEA